MNWPQPETVKIFLTEESEEGSDTNGTTIPNNSSISGLNNKYKIKKLIPRKSKATHIMFSESGEMSAVW